MKDSGGIYIPNILNKKGPAENPPVRKTLKLVVLCL